LAPAAIITAPIVAIILNFITHSPHHFLDLSHTQVTQNQPNTLIAGEIGMLGADEQWHFFVINRFAPEMLQNRHTRGGGRKIL
jgi:hypothetical protein